MSTVDTSTDTPSPNALAEGNHPGWGVRPVTPSAASQRYREACAQGFVEDGEDRSRSVADAVDGHAAVVREALVPSLQQAPTTAAAWTTIGRMELAQNQLATALQVPVVTSEFKILTRSTLGSKETVRWEDGNEYPLVKVHISSASHPFFTGEEKIMDIEGRVDKFKARAEAAKKALEAKKAAAEKATAKPAKKATEKKEAVDTTTEAPAKVDEEPVAETEETEKPEAAKEELAVEPTEAAEEAVQSEE